MAEIDISIDEVKVLFSNFKKHNKGITNTYSNEVRSLEQEMSRIKNKYSSYSYVVSKANDIRRLVTELDRINKDITTKGEKLSSGLQQVIKLTIESEQQSKTLIKETNAKISGKIRNGRISLNAVNLNQLESSFDEADIIRVNALSSSGIEAALEIGEYRNKLDYNVKSAVYIGGLDPNGVYRLGTDWEEQIFTSNKQYIFNTDLKTNLFNINAQRMVNTGTSSITNSASGNLYLWDPVKMALTGPNFALNSNISCAAFEDVNNITAGKDTSFGTYSRLATFKSEAKMNGSLFMIGNNRIQGPVLQGEANLHAALAEVGGNMTVGNPDVFALQGNANVAAVTGDAKAAIDFEAFDFGMDPITGMYIVTPPSFSGEANAAASAAKGSADITLGNTYANINGSAEGAALTASASAELEADLKDGDLYVKAEAGAAVLEGEVSGGVSILGLDIDVTLEGEAIAAGVKGGVGVKDDCFEIELGASLGIGGGAKLSVDWGDVKDTVIDWWDSLW
ncbi:hypothetical protein [Cellulosilyticum lentocellum]|uniref:Uncharacterized protein n=1 Tax=Cellulosilyticum lentocellum (strain ATCC 49066 / DSM 5427 / NCIMB 11756 / RHM5) TaxID=642492 RepID=F2JHU2_CELLD|nr:hypothetical protein [Cellulosilyticum lentocellum]ADZ85434.1 hypothetical protein Clole_3754 [Cellulosilyticum lentocellum DSM 5427]